ncbi:hypothetical protein HYPSUDRAFT_51621 [Hypholoma sublateritium FD-334 SS-4]|uniref:FAD-binding domain-containing protein n=1 Tax=Hypholoma sublateritium (strain FD-334 SS-4) TaxID=945553 RepID=A0A0D2Q9C4_HYPSF|nr:hypothetical protein HYPSUDRAFT_51621 [Hypholoma sublateritium FD-334 SS-4]
MASLAVDKVVKVLISGAGPSGLVLALSLRKNGIPVRIIDKELGPRLGERGAGVSARSLELHKILGTFPDVYGDNRKPIPWRRDYDPLDGHKIVKTFSMVPISEPTIGIPHGSPIFLGQNHHERILRSHLAELGTTVEFGTELLNFTQSENEVNVETIHRTPDGKEEVSQSTASWLIGADGAHSAIRKTLGLEFLGETIDSIALAFGDFKISGPPRKFLEQWGDVKTRFTFTRPSAQDPDVLNFMMAGDINIEEILSSSKATTEAFYNISGRRDIIIEDVIWSSKYRPNIRMVNKLRVGRVFLAGDAAHCHSPTGGQGLNSSIQDAFNLGWKLALVEKGHASESLLDTYAEERLPVIAEMLNKTTELLKHSPLAGKAAPPRSQADNIRADMSQLGVTYRGSSIILQKATNAGLIQNIGYNKASVDAAQPGDRAPEAPGLVDVSGNTFSVYSLLSPSRHTVFIFSGGYSGEDLDRISGLVRQQPVDTVHGVLVHSAQTTPADNCKFEKLLDEKGNAHATYKVDGPCIVIVRPDGVIGARVDDPSGVAQYFKTVFQDHV